MMLKNMFKVFLFSIAILIVLSDTKVYCAAAPVLKGEDGRPVWTDATDAPQIICIHVGGRIFRVIGTTTTPIIELKKQIIDILSKEGIDNISTYNITIRYDQDTLTDSITLNKEQLLDLYKLTAVIVRPIRNVRKFYIQNFNDNGEMVHEEVHDIDTTSIETIGKARLELRKRLKQRGLDDKLFTLLITDSKGNPLCDETQIIDYISTKFIVRIIARGSFVDLDKNNTNASFLFL